MEKYSIGKFIGVLRKSNGLTQQQLADKCNISNKTVSKWETGETLPDLELIAVLAEIFQVSCDELLHGQRSVNIKSNQTEFNNVTADTDKHFSHLLSRLNINMRILSIVSIAFAALGIFLFAILILNYLNLAAFITSIILTTVAIMLQIINIVFILQKLNFMSVQFHSMADLDKTIITYKRSLYNYSFIAFSTSFIMIMVFIVAVLLQ